MKPLAPLGAALLTLALLAACQQGGKGEAGASESRVAAPSNGESAVTVTDHATNETLHFTGTEPFWGGSVTGDSLTYTTPENQAGVTVPISRFSGNLGVGFSGTIDGKTFDLAVTEETCSDGMSDRTYPLSVKLALGEELRSGCAWSASKPFAGPKAP